MRKTLAAVTALLLATGLLMLGNSLLNIMLPLKMERAGLSTGLNGLIMSAYFGGLLLGAIAGPRVITRVGHIRAFAAFAAIQAAASLIYGLMPLPEAWFVLRLASGVCIAGLFAVMESWLNARSDNTNRGQMLGIYMVVSYSAMILGQLLVNLWDISGAEGFALGAVLVALSLVPVALTRVTAPDLSDYRPLSLSRLYRSSPLAVVGCVTAGLLTGSLHGIGPIFASKLGASVFQVSLFMGLSILGALMLQWPIGRLSDRYERRSVLLGVLVITLAASLGGALTIHVADPFPLVVAIGILLGGTMSAVYPLSLAQVYDRLPQELYVGAASGLLLAYGVGATLGPLTAGQAVGALGPHAYYAYIAVVACLFAIFVIYRRHAREAVPMEEQAAFVTMPRMSPLVAELDPRHDEMEVSETDPAASAVSSGSI